MTLGSFLLDGLAAAVGSSAAIVPLRRFPIRATVGDIDANARKAFYVIGAKKVSDRRKELVVPRYARRILIGTTHMAAYLTIVLGAFVVGFVAARLPFADAPITVLASLFQWETQLAAAATATPLFLVLGRRTR